MKILFWKCNDSDWDACHWVYEETKRQGYDCELAGNREDPAELLQKIETYKPDWIFTWAVRPHLNPVYRIIKSKNIKLAIVYNDAVNPSRIKMFEQMTGYFDLAIYSTVDAKERLSFCAKANYFIPEYIDTEFYTLDWKRLNPTKLIYDICWMSFVPCPYREEILWRLRKRYSVYEPQNKFGAEMTEVYAQSKIAIGLPRHGFSGTFHTSNRLYWAMGSGCFYLSQYIPEVDRFFTVGKHLEMVIHDTYKEFDTQIQYWLDPLNEIQRERIALYGQTEVLKNHTLKTRVKQFVELLERHKL